MKGQSNKIKKENTMLSETVPKCNRKHVETDKMPKHTYMSIQFPSWVQAVLSKFFGPKQ